MEKRTYSNPEVDVLCVESDVITQDSFNEESEKSLVKIKVSDIPG